jgi:predicted PurR-regulated permease PerM
LFGFFGILLALPAAAVLSVVIRFAYHRYLKEHPELDTESDIESAIEPDDEPDGELE